MAKKKPQKKPQLSLSLSPQEQSLLEDFLGDPQGLLLEKLEERILSPELASALVENLPPDNPATAQILPAIGRIFPQKPVQKALKKKAYQLRQRGLVLPALEPEPAPALSSAKEEPSAFIGPMDGAGNRPLLIAIPQRSSGMDLAMGAVHDEKGIIDFLFGRYSRKRAKEIKDLFFSRVPHLVETTLSHVATIVEQAYSREKETPGEAAGHYLRFRPWLLENTRLLERPAALGLVSDAGISTAQMTESRIQKLLDHAFMASCLLDPEKLRPLVEEIKRTQESPIVLSEAQRRERLFQIKADGIAKLFSEKDRETLRSRLQETAYVFYKIAEESMARLCLDTSSSLQEKDSPLRVNPFLSALLDRSLARLQAPGSRNAPLFALRRAP